MSFADRAGGDEAGDRGAVLRAGKKNGMVLEGNGRGESDVRLE